MPNSQEPNLIAYIQERIDMYANTKYPNKSSECMRQYWSEQMDLYKGYLAGTVKRIELGDYVREKLSGWVMPEWGYARS